MSVSIDVVNKAAAETITGPWIFNSVTLPTRTRRIPFIGAERMVQSNGTAMTLTTQGTYPDSWSQWPMVTAPAAVPQALYASFDVPQDYSSGGTFYVVFSQSGTSALLFRVEVNYAEISDGGDPTTASSVVAASVTPDGVTNREQVAQVGAVLGTLTAGNRIRFNIERDSAHADDTNPDILRLIGVAFEYTARY